MVNDVKRTDLVSVINEVKLTDLVEEVKVIAPSVTGYFDTEETSKCHRQRPPSLHKA